jgi:CheY-like chemotaxis protein
MLVRLPASSPGDRRQGPARRSRELSEVAEAGDEARSLCGLRILVVDDHPDAKEMAALVLAHHGAQVTTAGSAAEALSVLPNAAPDLLVVDLGMPEVDGFSLIREVRAGDGHFSRAPAIALTAYARDEDRRAALAAGFQLHLAKPVEPRVLVRAVRQLIRDAAGAGEQACRAAPAADLPQPSCQP